MNEIVEGIPLGYTVAEIDPESNLPQELAGKDLFGDVQEATVEAGLCGAWAEKRSRSAVFRVCAVVPLPDGGDGGGGRMPYERLERACENLGRALDSAFEVMARAVKVAATDGPEAGMRIVAAHYVAVAAEADVIPWEDSPAGTATGGADGAAGVPVAAKRE